MKPALYYAIRLGLYDDVVAVTSEKPTRGAWYGRTVKDNCATHGNKYGYMSSKLIGRFDSAEAAEAKRQQIREIRTRFDDARGVHNDAITKLYRDEDAEIVKVVGK